VTVCGTDMSAGSGFFIGSVGFVASGVELVSAGGVAGSLC